MGGEGGEEREVGEQCVGELGLAIGWLRERRELTKGTFLGWKAGFVSLWFRQTNIVWVALIAVNGVLRVLKKKAQPALYDPSLERATLGKYGVHSQS